MKIFHVFQVNKSWNLNQEILISFCQLWNSDDSISAHPLYLNRFGKVVLFAYAARWQKEKMDYVKDALL